MDGSNVRIKKEKDVRVRKAIDCPFKRRPDESITRFPRPCFVDESKVFWLPPGDEFFTSETYPPPKKIKTLSYKTLKECRRSCPKLRGKQMYVSYNCIWPFLFYPVELKVITKFIRDDERAPCGELPAGNVYQNTVLDEKIKERLQLPFYKKRNTKQALVNTLAYMFFKMRSGIYVKIRNNELVAFIPFFNNDYKNDWSKKITPFPENDDDWLKSRKTRTDFAVPRLKEIEAWEAHGCLIFNWEINRVSDRYIAAYADMFRNLCKERKLPDVDFFVNKNDFPMLKKDLTQPNPYVYQPEEMTRFKFDTYAPILSNCVTPEYADIPSPTPDDWMRVTRRYFPASCGNPYAILPKRVPWKHKVNTAFFRGASTGCGDSLSTNQRLKAAELSREWFNSPVYGKNNKFDNHRFLNAGVTRVTPQDTILSDDRAAHISYVSGKIETVKPVPMDKQTRYKYLLDLEGYAAAFRLGYMLGTGSVNLKADSPWKLWYADMMKPLVEYVPVQYDLDDLGRVIAWCKVHDRECQKIADNAERFQHKYLNRKGILDYLQLVLFRLAAT
jgi:hypothetical protein